MSPVSPQAGASKEHNSTSETHSIQSPASPGTNDAPTESISPGHFERLTPDNPPENYFSQSHKPTKRIRHIFTDDSESSVEMTPTPKKRTVPFMWNDFEDEDII